MSSTFEEAAKERHKQGMPQSVHFLLAELLGLLVGAAGEWIAKLSTDSSIRGRCLPDLRMMRPPGVTRQLWFVRRCITDLHPYAQDEVAEVAGFYSDQERQCPRWSNHMLVGHVAVGLTIKRLQPKLSLGTLLLAAMLADLLWCVFMIVGLEHVQFKPGRGAANYFVATNIALSHSLLMDGLWGALFAAIYFAARRHARAALIIFFAVLSHWFLDFISHKPDMPLAPGVHTYFGLGLWNSVPSAVLLEGSFGFSR